MDNINNRASLIGNQNKIKNQKKNENNVSFAGYKGTLDKTGKKIGEFFLPQDINTKAEKAVLEIFEVVEKTGAQIAAEDKANKNSSKGLAASYPNMSLWEVKEKPIYEVPFNPSEKVELNLDNVKNYFGYRFKLQDEKGNVKYVVDPGEVANARRLDDIQKVDTNQNNKFSIMNKNRPVITTPSNMQLVMFDIVNKGGKEAENVRRNSGIKLSGNFKDVTSEIPNLSKAGYTKIVGTPFTSDTVSSHGYWTKDIYQINEGFGTKNDYDNMQLKSYLNGISIVSDAAEVNESIEGIHFRHALKHKKDSPYSYWFTINDPDKTTIPVGILPKDTKNVGFKIVNSPYGKHKSQYNSDKSTYIQLYDKRFVTEDEAQNNELIKEYKIKNPSMKTNGLKSDDYDTIGAGNIMTPYSVEVNPKELKKEPKSLSDLYFSNIEVIGSNYAGYEQWDGNFDIPKLKYNLDNSDNLSSKNKLKMQQGSCQARDFEIGSGKYWTLDARNTALEYGANIINQFNAKTPEEYMKSMKKAVEEGKLPKNLLDAAHKIDEEVITNVKNGNYRLPGIDVYSNYNDLLLKELMDCPLGILRLADDLKATMDTPWISKRASVPEEVGRSRFEIAKGYNGIKPYENVPKEFKSIYMKSDDLYKDELFNLANQVLKEVSSKSKNKLFDDNGEITDLGRYAINLFTPDIVQYSMYKAMNPKLKFDLQDNNKIDFSKFNKDDLTLKSLKVSEGSSEDEASEVINVLKKGISSIKPEDKEFLVDALTKRLDNLNEDSIKLSHMIIDRTEWGLGWRLDASKDVASFNALRNQEERLDNIWDNVIENWKPFMDGVLSVNPHSYSTAEITDVDHFVNNITPSKINSQNDKILNTSKYPGPTASIAETKFLDKTNITSTANYNYLFSSIPGLFARNSENGQLSGEFNNIQALRSKLDEGWQGRLGAFFDGNLDTVLQSYTFSSNHDKPRILSTLALDLDLFFSKFENGSAHREIASKVLGKKVDDINFNELSAKSIAMGYRIFQEVEKLGNISDKDKKSIKLAIAELSSKTGPGVDTFGTMPINQAIEDTIELASKKYSLSLDKVSKDDLKIGMFKDIIEPAMDKEKSIYKMLVTLPGAPTDFIGDKLGSTGWETPCKNAYQQNRNVVPFSWVSENKESGRRDYIVNYKNDLDEILKLRNKKELSALADGIPHTLPMGPDDKHFAVYRYNDKGSQVISVYTADGANDCNNMKMDRKGVATDYLLLSKNSNIYNGQDSDTTESYDFRKVGIDLKEGTTFKKYGVENSPIYTIRHEDGECRLYPPKGQKIEVTPEDFNTAIFYKA